MSNPLDAIWDAHQTSLHALKVVRRCSVLDDDSRDRPFRNTRFHRSQREQLLEQLDAARSETDDLAVVSLYAAFEARLREHVAEQARLLERASGPGREFGRALANDFAQYCGDARMDKLVKLFADAVGEALVAQIGNIRVFRHRVAHGRSRQTRPSVPPLFAYKTLTKFLTLAKLI